MKVLVYETSKDRAKLIQDLLKNYRYKIKINYSQSSIEDIRDFQPSLIIMNMKSRANLELLERLKKHSRLSKVPVILISNFNSQEIMEKIRQFQNVDFLVEPFKIKNFRHIVERWINFRSLYVD